MPTKFVENIFEESKIEEIALASGFKKYIISGLFTMCNTPNGNNRIYPKDVLQEAITKLKPKVKQGRIKMSLDHPNYEGKLKNTCAILKEITDLDENNKAYYRAQIVDTEDGKNLKAILDGGGVVGVSTRGYGDCLFDQEWPGLPGKYVVIRPGFKLETIDFVEEPSVSETEEEIQLENKQGSKKSMKTIEELKKEFPDIFKDYESKFETEKKSFTDKIIELNASLKTMTENFEKIVSNVKEMKPDLFTTIPVTEVTKQKETEITSLKEQIKDGEKKLSEVTAKLEQSEKEKAKVEKDKTIETLRAKDPVFFSKDILVKKFETCVTSDEVQKVYESNKALLDSLKDDKNFADPKTKQPEKKTDDGLDENMKVDFEQRNQDRRNSGLPPMTIESYKKLIA